MCSRSAMFIMQHLLKVVYTLSLSISMCRAIDFRALVLNISGKKESILSSISSTFEGGAKFLGRA